MARSRSHIGIIATRRTVESGTYVAEIRKLGSQRVTQVAAPLLVPIVEEGLERDELARLAVARTLAALPPVDSLLLGCTHYPLLRPAIEAALPPGVAVLDPAPYLAERLVDWLARHPGFDGPSPAAGLRVLSTGDPAAFARHGARFLGAALPPVEHVAEQRGRLAHRDPAETPRGQVVR